MSGWGDYIVLAKHASKNKKHLLGTSTHNSIHAKVLVEEHAATYIHI